MSLFGSTKDEKNYLVAYFDVLGTKERAKKDIDSTISGLELINHLLTKEVFNSKNVIVKSFSDNFLVAIEDDNGIKNFETLTKIICIIAYLCFKNNGTLIRGSITRGKMIINDQIVLGEALIRAYKIEEEVAVYPRIVIDKTLINCVNVSLSNRNLKEWIYLDFDMEYCLNFLKIFAGKQEEAYRVGLKARLAELLLKMKDETNLKVKAKFNYLINYINNYYLENYGSKLLDLALI